MRALVIYDDTLSEFATHVVRLVNFIDSYRLIDVSVDPKEIVFRVPDVILVFADLSTAENRPNEHIYDLAEMFRFGKSVPVLSVFVGGGEIPPTPMNAGYYYFSCLNDSTVQRKRLASQIDEMLEEIAMADLESERVLDEERRRHSSAWHRELTRKGLLTAASLIPACLVVVFHERIIDVLNGIMGVSLTRVVFILLGILIGLFFGICYVRLLFALLRGIRQSFYGSQREEELEDAARYARRLRSVVEYDSKDEEASSLRVNALERMLVNLEDIRAYYKWSQEQARSAFRLAWWLCIAGFVFLVAAAVLPPALGMGWQASVIPAVGGAASELLAGTALLVYRHSLTQLNYYHDALHEDERFLSAVSLVDRFDAKEKRDEILAEIVKSELRMNLYAAGARDSDKDSFRTDDHCDAQDDCGGTKKPTEKRKIAMS